MVSLPAGNHKRKKIPIFFRSAIRDCRISYILEEILYKIKLAMNKIIPRRAAIRNLLIIAGGAMILPACYRKSGKPSIQLNNFSLTEDDEGLLEMLCETIVPETDSPGAKSLKLHMFVLKMVDDCYKKEDQQIFIKGLEEFGAFAKEKTGKNFLEASVPEREGLLKTIQGDEKKDEVIPKFYQITKSKTIQGYLNSEYVMTNLVKYELVPGRYNGYFPA